jgi:hypothetical protein
VAGAPAAAGSGAVAGWGCAEHGSGGRAAGRGAAPAAGAPGLVLEVELDGADQGLAPGQYAAFYDGDCCLGAGVMAEVAALVHR